VIFNKHFNLAGKHAFLSASKHHWLGYDEDKLARVYEAQQAAQRGTRLHALAHDLIRENVKLPAEQKTLNMYVNDAIGFQMQPEQVLYYSDNAFGTADAILFKRDKLRIHDLKTGLTPASENQLYIYAGLFCLEYIVNPNEIEMELRIYQDNEIQIYNPEPHVIFHVMDRIVTFDKFIREYRAEVTG
jgi:hypothetical protein